MCRKNLRIIRIILWIKGAYTFTLENLNDTIKDKLMLIFH